MQFVIILRQTFFFVFHQLLKDSFVTCDAKSIAIAGKQCLYAYLTLQSVKCGQISSPKNNIVIVLGKFQKNPP